MRHKISSPKQPSDNGIIGLFGLIFLLFLPFWLIWQLLKKLAHFFKTKFDSKSPETKENITLVLLLIFFWPVALYKITKMRPYWLKKKWFLPLFSIYALSISMLFFAIAAPFGRVHPELHEKWDQTISEELNRNYEITLDESLSPIEQDGYAKVYFACELEEKATEDSTEEEKYLGEKSELICKNATLTGSFSEFSNVIFSGYGKDFEPLVSSNRFSIIVPEKIFTSSDWESSSSELGNRADMGKLTLSLENSVLSYGTMAKKIVRVFYLFSDEDRALFNSKKSNYQSYKAEQERIKQEQLAKEKAEQEKREQEEKARKEQEERAKQQEAAKNETKQESSQKNTSPSSGVDYLVHGYCNDGTYVYGDPSAKGKANACYGHKGWRDY